MPALTKNGRRRRSSGDTIILHANSFTKQSNYYQQPSNATPTQLQHQHQHLIIDNVRNIVQLVVGILPATRHVVDVHAG